MQFSSFLLGKGLFLVVGVFCFFGVCVKFFSVEDLLSGLLTGVLAMPFLLSIVLVEEG